MKIKFPRPSKKGMTFLIVLIFILVSQVMYWGLLRVNSIQLQRSNNWKNYYKFQIQEKLSHSKYTTHIEEQAPLYVLGELSQAKDFLVQNQKRTINNSLVRLNWSPIFKGEYNNFYGHQKINSQSGSLYLIYYIEIYLDEASTINLDEYSNLPIAGIYQDSRQVERTTETDGYQFFKENEEKLLNQGYKEYLRPSILERVGNVRGFVPKRASFEFDDSILTYLNNNWKDRVKIQGQSTNHNIILDKYINLQTSRSFLIRSTTHYYTHDNVSN